MGTASCTEIQENLDFSQFLNDPVATEKTQSYLEKPVFSVLFVKTKKRKIIKIESTLVDLKILSQPITTFLIPNKRILNHIEGKR